MTTLNTHLSLSTAVQNDGSRRLHICPKLDYFSAISSQLFAHTFSFLSFDHLWSAQFLNKKIKSVADNAMEKFRGKFDLESPTCSYILTGMYNIVLGNTKEPREALKRVQKVSIYKDKLLLLHDSSLTPNYRRLKGLDYSGRYRSELCEKAEFPRTNRKFKAAHAIMKMAIAYPPHLTFSERIENSSLDASNLEEIFRGRSITKLRDHESQQISYYRLSVETMEQEGASILLFQASRVEDNLQPHMRSSFPNLDFCYKQATEVSKTIIKHGRIDATLTLSFLHWSMITAILSNTCKDNHEIATAVRIIKKQLPLCMDDYSRVTDTVSASKILSKGE